MWGTCTQKFSMQLAGVHAGLGAADSLQLKVSADSSSVVLLLLTQPREALNPLDM